MLQAPRRWNVPLIRQLFDVSSAEAILSIYLPLANCPDRWIWTPESKGTFSVKSSYHFISHATLGFPSSFSPLDWKSLWRLQIHSRLKLLLWKCMWNILPTQSRLNSIFLNGGSDLPACFLCCEHTDSLYHLIFQCPYSRVAWRESLWVLRIEFFLGWSITDWARLILDLCSIGILREDCYWFQLFALVLLDLLWFHRNQMAHGQSLVSIQDFSTKVFRVAFEHLQAWQVRPLSRFVAVWASPSFGVLKLILTSPFVPLLLLLLVLFGTMLVPFSLRNLPFFLLWILWLESFMLLPLLCVLRSAMLFPMFCWKVILQWLLTSFKILMPFPLGVLTLFSKLCNMLLIVFALVDGSSSPIVRI